MGKGLVLLVVCSFMTIPLLAQSAISSIEIIGGPVHSYFGGVNTPTDQVRNLSLSGGLGFSRSVSRHFEVSAMLLLDRKGFKEDHTITFFDKKNNSTTSRYVQGLKLDYTTMQMYSKVLIGKKNHFFIGFGGYFSFLRKAKYYTREYSLSGLPIYYQYVDGLSDFKHFDFGLLSIAGYQKKITSKIYFVCQARINWGLMDIRSITQSVYSYKNNTMSLLIGFKLNMKDNETQ